MRQFNTQLFLEGIQIDLSDDIDIANTYGIADIQKIGSKQSAYSKTITLPGTSNNNKLFSFLYDIKSTGANSSEPIAGFSANIVNLVPFGVQALSGNCDGATWAFPVSVSGATGSFHNEIKNTPIYLDVECFGGITAYMVCCLNGVVISCNQIVTAPSFRYYFPFGDYNYNDVITFVMSPVPVAFSGNIGYDLDFKKRMRAYVIEDNQVVLSGYAKIVSATQTNGAVSYSIQITSDLGGFIAAIANGRLEDLYTVQAPDLAADPTGQVAKSITLDSPFDHFLTLANIDISFFGILPYVYPLADYGNDDTVGQTNFYTSCLRPAVRAKDYFNIIFDQVGFSYESNFLNSPYFQNLIIPYKDGNISIIDVFPVDVTSSATDSLTVAPSATIPQSNGFYIYNTIVNDNNNVYSGIRYTAKNPGTYNASGALTFNFDLVPGAGTAGIPLVTPQITTFVLFEVWPASGGTDPYAVYQSYIINATAGVTVLGNPAFVGTVTSDNITAQIAPTPVIVKNAGDTIRVRISSTVINAATNFFPEAANFAITKPGTATINIINDSLLGLAPTLHIEYSSVMDGQFLRFKDFVPKSVKQLDYINSIIKLFNLYPVQDDNRKNHFIIYTRDEYYSNQNTKDWTQKIDLLSDISVRPIPEITGAQLLFAYKEDKDWFNKQYASLYGNFGYGSLRIQTGYEFANDIQNVVDGLLFSPTPSVQYGINNFPGEGPIEILNNNTLTSFPSSDHSSDIVMSTGYYAAMGTFSPYSSQTSFPVQNTFSGTPFLKAKAGVHINYWGTEYIISEVFNQFSFRVTDLNGNATTLRRPITANSQQRISDTYYASNDGFSYVSNSDLIIPAIYDSSDNNLTHAPIKTEMKILYFQPLSESTTKNYNQFIIQYTPVTVNGIFTYQPTGTWIEGHTNLRLTQAPFCGHLNDPVNPTFDLLFAPPVSLFFTIDPDEYPSLNLYSKFWVNTVNEITDKDAKIMEAMLNLNSVDISTLDLSDVIYINGTNFRINQIKDYTPDSSLTAVEFIRQPKFISTTSGLIVDAGFDQTVSGSTTNLFGTVTGDIFGSGGALTVKWTQLSGPSGATIVSSGSTSTEVDFTQAGTYVFQLFASEAGQTGSDTVSITVVTTVCNPLVVIANDGPVTVGGDLHLNSTFSLPCPSTHFVSFNWMQISGSTGGVLLSGTTAHATVSGVTNTGSSTWRLTITDNFGNSGFADTVAVVNPTYTIRVLNAISTAGISSVTGVTGYSYLSGPTYPFSGTGAQLGTHSALVAANVHIFTSGTIPPGTFHMNYTLNGTFQSAQVATSGGDYVFTITCLSTDILDFELST